MKRIADFCFIILLSLIFAMTAFASTNSVKIDGVDSAIEWSDSDTYIILRNNSNCDVDFACVKYKFVEKDSALYLCFMFSDPHFSSDPDADGGVIFSVENSSPFEITFNNVSDSYDYYDYSFDAAIGRDEQNGATCEMRIGLKNGMPEQLSCTVRFVDCYGHPSNVYDFILVNKNYIPPVPTVLAGTTHKSTTEKSTKDSSSRTTTVKNPQNKTTTSRETSTERTTIDDRTIYTPNYIKRKTTTKPTTTNKPTTTKATTEKKTTAKQKKSAGVTVYYIKEVLVTLPTTISVSETISETTSEETCETSTQQNSATVSVSKGAKYKKLLILLTAVLLLPVAGFGLIVCKSKRDPKTCEETTDVNDSEKIENVNKKSDDKEKNTESINSDNELCEGNECAAKEENEYSACSENKITEQDCNEETDMTK